MDDDSYDDGGATPSAAAVSPGMMLKAKMAPHLIHDHEWDQMASQIAPRRIGDSAPGAQTPMTPMRPTPPGAAPELSATDAPVDSQYRQPTSQGQQAAQMAERKARMNTTPGQAPATPGATPLRPAPRREASNPVTGDQGPANNTRSGPMKAAAPPVPGTAGGGRTASRFSNPTSANIYADHVKKLFNPLGSSSSSRTPLRRIGSPAMA